jgi:small subunit ribosomal protein S15
MALASEQKAAIINEYRTHSTDTGSPEVQVALLTHRITDLGAHFASHLKDHHGRRGLLMLVSQRKSLLEYLRSRNVERYRSLISRLGLRK